MTDLPQSISGVIGLFVAILYAIESVGLLIFIVANYNAFVTGDINIIPALLLMYGFPGALWIIATILEAIQGAMGGV